MYVSVPFKSLIMRSIFITGCMLIALNINAKDNRKSGLKPTFQQYPVKVEKVKAQPIRIYGDSKRYKTFLTALKSQPINFAGHYVLDTYGCGGGCQGIGIYNAKTGVAFIHQAQFSECYSEKYGWHDRDYDMRINSRLLILMGRRTEDIARCEKVYYLIEGDRLREVKSEMIFQNK